MTREAGEVGREATRRAAPGGLVSPDTPGGHAAALLTATELRAALDEAERRAEAAERDCRARDAILARVTDAFFALDGDWRFTYLNPQAEALLQRTREELLGQNIWDAFPELAGSPFDRHYHEAVECQVAVHFEACSPSRDTWSAVHAYPARDGLSVYFQDITARREAEAALRRRERELADFVENGVMGLHWVGPDGTILWANRAELELLGYAPEEYIGRHIAEFHADADTIVDILARLTRAEELHSYEARLRRKDGAIRHVLISSNVLWEDGRFVRTRCFTRDITDRKEAEEALRALNTSLEARVAAQTAELTATVARLEAEAAERRRAEEALRESEARFRNAFDDAAIGMALVAPDGRYLQVNPALGALLGYTEDELLATSFQALTHPDDLAADLDLVRRLLAGEIATYQLEKRYVHQAGHPVWALLSVSLLRDSAGQPAYFVSQVQDITARKGEEELRRRQAREVALRAEVGTALAAGGPLRVILQRCAEAIVAHLDAALARVWTFNEPEQVLELQASAGLYTQLDGPHARVPLDRAKIGQIARERRPHLTNDVPHDPQVSDRAWAAREGMVAFAGYPLVVDERLVGAMALFARQPLAQGTLDALASVATAVAQSIERKRAEEALRASEARHRAIVDTAADAIVTATAAGEIASFNRGAEAIFGYAAREVLGRPLTLLMPERFREAHETGLHRYLTTQESRILGRPVELAGRRKDGGEFPLELTLTAASDDRGPFFAGILRDITDRKAAEAALRASETQLNEAQRIAHLGNFWRDLEKGEMFFSDELYRIHGLEPGTGDLSAGLLAVVHPEDVGRVKGWMDAILAGQPGHIDHRIVRPDGEVRYVHQQVEPVIDEAGRLRRLAGTMLDITERKQAEEARRQTEAHFRALAEHASDIVLLLDPDGSIRYASPSTARVLGYPAEELTGADSFAYIHPDDAGRARDTFAAHLQQPGVGAPFALLLWHRDGSWRQVEVVSNNLLDDPDIRGLVVNARDVTERVRAEVALRTSEARNKALVEATPDLLFRLDREGRFLDYQVNDERQLYALPGSIVDRTIGETLPAAVAERALAAIARTLETGAVQQFEYTLPMPAGPRDYEARFVVSGPGEVLVVVRDVTARKALERQLTHQAFHDALTGLANRALFLDRLAHALDRTTRDGSALALLFLDLDRFKVVNDSLGHAAGDHLLVAAAERLAGCIRPGDTLARLGGDEFTLLLEDVAGTEAATAAAERILQALQAPFTIAGHEFVVSASIGVVVERAGTRGAGELLRQADLAMYDAKQAGKARYALFDQRMTATALERLELEADLRQALERGEFALHYQPKVDLGSGLITGLEALVRWTHPTRGPVSPAVFISLAEEMGLIRPLGHWVLEEACRQACAWREEYPGAPLPIICVNLSATEFGHPALAEDVADALRRHDLAPGMLELEITESVVMADVAATTGTLRRLKELGVQLAIDDFGTGYSSLAYLKRFPVDALKIDRAFVDGLGRDPEDTALVGTMVTLGHALGLLVVAEGVETADHAARLRELGCDQGQGFFFARPLPAAEVTALLAPTARAAKLLI